MKRGVFSRSADNFATGLHRSIENLRLQFAALVDQSSSLSTVVIGEGSNVPTSSLTSLPLATRLRNRLHSFHNRSTNNADKLLGQLSVREISQLTQLLIETIAALERYLLKDRSPSPNLKWTTLFAKQRDFGIRSNVELLWIIVRLLKCDGQLWQMDMRYILFQSVLSLFERSSDPIRHGSHLRSSSTQSSSFINSNGQDGLLKMIGFWLLREGLVDWEMVWANETFSRALSQPSSLIQSQSLSGLKETGLDYHRVKCLFVHYMQRSGDDYAAMHSLVTYCLSSECRDILGLVLGCASSAHPAFLGMFNSLSVDDAHSLLQRIAHIFQRKFEYDDDLVIIYQCLCSLSLLIPVISDHREDDMRVLFGMIRAILLRHLGQFDMSLCIILECFRLLTVLYSLSAAQTISTLLHSEIESALRVVADNYLRRNNINCKMFVLDVLEVVCAGCDRRFMLTVEGDIVSILGQQIPNSSHLSAYSHHVSPDQIVVVELQARSLEVLFVLVNGENVSFVMRNALQFLRKFHDTISTTYFDDHLLLIGTKILECCLLKYGNELGDQSRLEALLALLRMFSKRIDLLVSSLKQALVKFMLDVESDMFLFYLEELIMNATSAADNPQLKRILFEVVADAIIANVSRLSHSQIDIYVTDYLLISDYLLRGEIINDKGMHDYRVLLKQVLALCQICALWDLNTINSESRLLSHIREKVVNFLTSIIKSNSVLGIRRLRNSMVTNECIILKNLLLSRNQRCLLISNLNPKAGMTEPFLNNKSESLPSTSSKFHLALTEYLEQKKAEKSLMKTELNLKPYDAPKSEPPQQPLTGSSEQQDEMKDRTNSSLSHSTFSALENTKLDKSKLVKQRKKITLEELASRKVTNKWASDDDDKQSDEKVTLLLKSPLHESPDLKQHAEEMRGLFQGL